MKQMLRPAYCPNAIMIVFAFLLFLVSACGGGSSSDSSDDNPQVAYQRAVQDAMVAEPDEIVVTLTSIAEYNTNLIWEGEPGDSRVLMVSWVDGDYYDNSVGQDYELPSWLRLWVTAAPELRTFFASWSFTDETALKHRIEQLLGMPLNTGKTKFVEFWVHPDDLARPCPDPGITDSVCELNFPSTRFQQLSPEYRQWFEENRASSYNDSDPYPWTRLGYTCDWYLGQGCDIGLSEFLIWSGSTVGVKSVQSTSAYLAQPPHTDQEW